MSAGPCWARGSQPRAPSRRRSRCWRPCTPPWPPGSCPVKSKSPRGQEKENKSGPKNKRDPENLILRGFHAVGGELPCFNVYLGEFGKAQKAVVGLHLPPPVCGEWSGVPIETSWEAKLPSLASFGIFHRLFHPQTRLRVWARLAHRTGIRLRSVLTTHRIEPLAKSVAEDPKLKCREAGLAELGQLERVERHSPASHINKG